MLFDEFYSKFFRIFELIILLNDFNDIYDFFLTVFNWIIISIDTIPYSFVESVEFFYTLLNIIFINLLRHTWL